MIIQLQRRLWGRTSAHTLISHARNNIISQQPSAKKILITSALPYVNNVPHLGNVIGCVLSADVFARYQRSIGMTVCYICGTDEYGTATEVRAMQEKVSPRELCDKYYLLHKQAYEWLEVQFDYFGRTSSKSHTAVVQEIFKHLDGNGFISSKQSKQHYCGCCSMYLADRYVVGKCPVCSSSTKGDQCDTCNKLESSLDIVDPTCVNCGTKPQTRQVEHLYLNLGDIEPQLKQWAASRISQWSSNAQNITKDWLGKGLHSRSITRNLKWGIQVPKPGYEDRVFYVWFDAPIGYISMTAQLMGERYKEWWLQPNTTSLYQFMGKDNVQFHSVMFPACMLGTRKPYTTVSHLSATEYLMYEGKKFSKSNGVGVFCDSLPSTNIQPSLWRFYLISIRPETCDISFEWDEFRQTVNSQLLGNFGNFIQRLLSLLATRYGNNKLAISAVGAHWTGFFERSWQLLTEYCTAMEAVQLKKGLEKALQMSSLANKWMQDNKPWDKQMVANGSSAQTLSILLCYLRLLFCVMEPFVPGLSTKASHLLGLKHPDRLSYFQSANAQQFQSKLLSLLVDNTTLPKPVPLVKQISAADIASLRAKYTPAC